MDRSRFECWGAIETLWLATAVAVPLVFNPWGANSFELPKAALLRALALLMAVAALHETRRRLPPRFLLTGLGWGAALALAALVSVNPHASLWGSYERQQGVLTLAAYLVLFLLTAAHLRTRVQVERLWRALVWGSAPVVVYGLAQAAGLDPFDWRTDAASPVLATIGRANFVGSYLVLIIPLTAGWARIATRRWPYALLLVAQLTCLALTRARAAWVGLSVVGLVWLAATGRRRWASVGLALAVAVASLSAWLDLPALPRTDAGSTAARLTIWRATLPLLAERPWLGYGPETMRPVFARVFPPQLVYYQGRHVQVDRAHNLWLDLGMSAGLAGVMAFVALLAVWGWSAWRGWRAATDSWERALWTALLAAVAGHLADLQFGFELTASAIVFWLALAVGAALARGLDAPEPRARALFFPLRAVLPALAALVLVALIVVRPFLADVAYQQSRRGTSSPQERLAAAARAARLWPLEPKYRLGLAELYWQTGDPWAAEVQLDAVDRLSPGDPEIWAARCQFYAQWGASEPGRCVQAEAACRRAVALAPDVATYHTALGLVLTDQGRLVEGLVELERAVDLDATDGVAYGYLAELYRALGREVEAAWASREAARWGGE